MTLQENQHITLPLVSCKWTYDQEKTMIETADRMQSANKSFRNEYIWNNWQFKYVSWALEGTEGSTKFKTVKMCHSHWDKLHRRYKDVKLLQMKRGARWNDESSMIELPMEQWNELTSMPTSTNKRLGWFRKGRFPLYHAFGAIVDRQMARDNVRLNAFAPADRCETTDIESDQLERTSSEHLKSLSSDQSNQELRQEKLGSETAHDLSISLMADSSILSNKSTKKRKFVKEKSASNEDVQGRLTSAVSTIRSSESARKNPRKSTAQLFIDSMESMQDRFLNRMNVDLTASPSGSMKAPLEYVVMAVDLLQKMKNLDTELLFKALDLFKDQQEYAAMFVGLQNEDLRIDWLKYKLERL